MSLSGNESPQYSDERTVSSVIEVPSDATMSSVSVPKTGSLDIDVLVVELRRARDVRVALRTLMACKSSRKRDMMIAVSLEGES